VGGDEGVVVGRLSYTLVGRGTLGPCLVGVTHAVCGLAHTLKGL